MSKSTHSQSSCKTIVQNSPETVVSARYPSAIGVDVHAKLLVCAFQDGTSPSFIKTEIQNFGTTYSQLSAFAQWCKQCNPSIVVMESTGVLWRSVYAALEDVGFTAERLALVNARDVKAIIGRKTDREDAQRLAEIARLGNIKKSFVPSRPFREMRQLARRYQTITQDIASGTNVYHKLLNATGCRAGSVFSDVKGVVATAILEAKLDQAENFAEVVTKYSRRLKASAAEVLDALNFDIAPVVRQQLVLERNHLAAQKKFAEETFELLRQMQEPYEEHIRLLQSIPGIREKSARLIFAELSDDLAEHFADTEHFCSWLGICPGNKISAEKSYSGKPSKGNKWLRRVLIECAHGIALSKCELKEKFMVWKLRRGSLRAIVALAHYLARVIFSVLKNRTMFKLVAMTTQRDELVNRVQRNIKALKRTGCALHSSLLIEKSSGVIIGQIAE
ncbi:MAG: IS110 family transposase [Duodenibacillus sp.]|nr:IS110 family transposase [Duodenibacillus sp.]